MEIKIDDLQRVFDSKNTQVEKEFFLNVNYRDLETFLQGYRDKYDAARAAYDAAVNSYREDCASKDDAIQQERESLRREIEMKDGAIQAASKELTQALIRKDTVKVAALKKQIGAATEAKNDAAATLEALAGAVPEYDGFMLGKADELKAPVNAAVDELGKVRNLVWEAVEVLRKIYDANSDYFYRLKSINSDAVTV